VSGLELSGEVTKLLDADLAALEEIDETIHSVSSFPASTLERFLF
jgi:hypothetical protein